MAAAMTGSAFFGVGIPVQAADEWISDGDLSDTSTSEPAPDDVLPNENQYNYQKEELAAFCHFGPNTFNEIEWGENYGNRTPDDIFTLETDFDEETLVKALKDAGFTKLIVTAKHHDGFCIWDSTYTEYDVAATSYQDANGQKDILAEISAACSKYDIDMGLYLSPWDIHDDSYGYYDEAGEPTTPEKDHLDYNEYYNNQLEEILGNDKYGNKGHFVEVWMDGAKGSGQDAQEYDFVRWFNTIQANEGVRAGFESDCMLFGAEAYTTVRWIGNENGYAHKNTWSKSIVDKENNTIDSNSQGEYTIGHENGNQWTVPEADARITSGWFWGTTKNTPKSIETLGNMYFNSVGHNSPLLLNIPPNNEGTVDEAILKRVEEFGENIEETFADNLAKRQGAEVYATDVRGGSTKFGPGKTVDGDDSTYWTTSEGENTGSLLIDLGQPRTFDVVSVEEAIQNGQRINSYTVEYRTGEGAWTEMESGVTIGAKRLVRTVPVTADQIRITVSVPQGKVPMISEVGVFKASEGFEMAGAAPMGMEVIGVEDRNAEDGAGFTYNIQDWTAETGPNFVNGQNRWANAGKTMTFQFHGSKFYIVGTTDPNHGNAVITIDNGEPVTVSTKADARSTGQIWYTSPDLTDGDHTVTITSQDGAVGIEAAYVINNGGVGMIGLEYDEYTMNEAEEINVKVIRVGGSTGKISALLTGNPGSAVQGDFDTNPQSVTLGDGETETTVPIISKRSDDEREPVESRYFTVVLDTPSPEDLILGFNDTARVNILDAEWMTTDKLQALVTEVDGRVESQWTGDYAAYAAALTEAKALLAMSDPDALEMMLAYQALEAAAEAMAEKITVTASVDGGYGDVSITSDQTTWETGSDVTVQFTPVDGYAVEEVLLNGTSVMSDEIRDSNSYTFTVTEDTEIIVRFGFYHYVETNRFYFPTEEGETGAKTLEAEHFILTNTGENETWPLEIAKAETGANGWPSNGKYVNSLSAGDTIELYYYAQKAGEYKVTMYYQSGNGSNKIDWTEAAGNIADGTATVEHFTPWGETLQPYSQEFTWTVNTPGAGVLTISTGDAGAPQLDKFDIQLVTAGAALETDRKDLEVKIAEAEAEALKTDIYTADSIAKLNEAIAVAKSAFESSDATQEAVDAQIRLLTESLRTLEKIPRYSVQVIVPENGSIGISGIDENSTVKEGDSVNYTVSPASGYVIGTFTINGTPVPDAAGKAYYEGTLDDVRENITFAATFTKETTNPNPEPGQPGTGNPQYPGTPGGSAGDGSTTGTSQNGSGDKAVETGDVSSPMLWMLLLVAAVLSGAAGFTMKQKSKKK